MNKFGVSSKISSKIKVTGYFLCCFLGCGEGANERMAMMDDFKEEVRLENEKKKKETEGRPSKNYTPIGVPEYR